GPRTEKQPYTVVQKDKELEIRWYPAVYMATLRTAPGSFRSMGYSGFRKLAGYIFGNNASKTKIAMTAPVHMDMNEVNPSMSFVLPSSSGLSTWPVPNDPDVQIEKSKEEYVAAIEFGGFVSDKDIQFYSQKLDKLLQERGIRHKGNFRYLGYNPPYRVIGRKNEIIVTIEWKSE
ncbi:MAG: hypothetical protein RL732_1582, partial [Bacteroidota bacterium]